MSIQKIFTKLTKKIRFF